MTKVPSGWDTGPGNHRDLVGRYGKRKSAPKGSFNGKTEAMAATGQNAFRAIVERRNKRSVWNVGTMPFAEGHFATFPEALIVPCILAGVPEGGVVLDPFMGAGTTALVALRANRKFLGIELNPEYKAMAERRIAPELKQGKLL